MSRYAPLDAQENAYNDGVDETDESAPINEEEIEKTMRPLVATSGERMVIRGVEICCAIFLAIVGIVIIILAAVSNQFDLNLTTVAVFREGALSTNTTFEAYPAATIQVLGPVNVTILFAVAVLLGSIGFFLAWFMNGSEMTQISGGSNGYMWATFMLSHILLWEAVILVAGMNELSSLILFGILVFAWFAVLWLGDLLNQRFYRAAMMRTMGSRWSWAFFIFVLLISIPALILMFVHLGLTFSGDTQAPTLLVVVPIVATVFFLIFLLIVALHYVGVAFLESTVTYNTVLYVFNGVMLFVIPATHVIVSAFDPVIIAP